MCEIKCRLVGELLPFVLQQAGEDQCCHAVRYLEDEVGSQEDRAKREQGAFKNGVSFDVEGPAHTQGIAIAGGGRSAVPARGRSRNRAWGTRAFHPATGI